MAILRVILGDQLTHTLSSLDNINPHNDIILMCEVSEETDYVKHHQKKIAFLFSAMRHFAEELEIKKFRVDYIRFTDPNNTGSIQKEVQRALQRHQIHQIIITQPGEYRLLKNIKTWSNKFNIPVEIREDNRFLCSLAEFNAWTRGRKQLRMEYFYREMRKKYSILMNHGEPIGGQWNYDAENRKSPKHHHIIPKPYQTTPDSITIEVIELVSEHFKDHFGDILPFSLAVTRIQALEALEQFIHERLIYFGDFQDAMLQDEPWMYHSHLSFYLNCGLLEPLECIQAAEKAYLNNEVPLNAAEGFIRQILGWREFVRGIYWLTMPNYADLNFLNAKQPLPEFYWSANTQMNCLKQCVTETKKHAYAHHIQRLMVLGNFALLAGINPKFVNEWFLIVYADAYEWVELPNVTGMVLFADGGFLGSKPYAASGNYIQRMSNYCKNCHYRVEEKHGEKACPFNYLYWDFIARNQDLLSNNPRMSMIYKSYKQMDEDKKNKIRYDSQRLFEQLERKEIV